MGIVRLVAHARKGYRGYGFMGKVRCAYEGEGLNLQRRRWVRVVGGWLDLVEGFGG